MWTAIVSTTGGGVTPAHYDIISCMATALEAGMAIIFILFIQAHQSLLGLATSIRTYSVKFEVTDMAMNGHRLYKYNH